MSDIFGSGFGSSHNWKRGFTSAFKSTSYRCEGCGTVFFHNYDDVPNIHKAIELQGISDSCSGATETVSVQRQDPRSNDQ